VTIKDKVFAAIRETFSGHTGGIDENTSATQVAGWDSFSHVQLMFLIEEKIDKPIDISDTFSLNNVGDLVSYLEKL
jgi:acyl carrier protein